MTKHRLLNRSALRRAEATKIQLIWGKGKFILGCDPRLWRLDECGALIYRFDYGNRESKYGWEIDHIIPKSKGGSNHTSNLRPLHWRINASRQAKPLKSPVIAQVKPILMKRTLGISNLNKVRTNRIKPRLLAII